jgi:cytochrome c-type biogenesis protein
MGIIVGFIGEQSLAIVQQEWLIALAGVFMIILGLITMRGKKVCSYINLDKKFKGDAPGTFLFGIFFAIGWTACLGPILAGILGMSAILGNVWYSGLLLFFYSLGNFVPLFILSVFYDKFKLSESKFIQGKVLTFTIFGKQFHVHSTNLISGVLFVLIGAVLIIYKGTYIFNSWDIFGTKDYFYSIQRQLMEWQYANVLGIVLLVLFVLVVGGFLWKNKKKKIIK